MGIKLANNAFGTLASGIASGATSITLTTGHGARFPSLGAGDYFYATLIDTSNNLEIVKCTARSTDVLTVVRAQESTTARAYSAGDRIEIRLTAQTFTDAVAEIGPTQISDKANTSTGYIMMPAGTTAQRPGSPSVGMVRWNTTLSAMEYYNGTSWSQQFVAQYTADYLVVAGGGAGGNYGGGGGAGGYLSVTNALLSAGNAYTITVGGGGAGASVSPRYGGNGSNSSFTGSGLSTTSIGGGGGGGNDGPTVDAQSGRAGGSGGGASYQNAAGTYGVGTVGQGNDGGPSNGASGNSNRGGGGGGAGAAGVSGSSTGNGGAGSTWLNGTAYAGGGGGGGSALTNSTGGTGGGGSFGNPGTANTGGGGGSGNDNAASSKNGGSGIVIIRYAGTTQRGSGGTVTTAGGYTYHTFNSSGTYTA